MTHMTQSNRQGWDGLAATHYKTYHIDKLLAGTPLLNDLIRGEVGDVQGKSLAHLLCHIGTDTLSWALLGAQVTGIDISEGVDPAVGATHQSPALSFSAPAAAPSTTTPASIGLPAHHTCHILRARAGYTGGTAENPAGGGSRKAAPDLAFHKQH